MSRATNPQNLRKGTRVEIIDPAVAGAYKIGHKGVIIDVTNCRPDAGDPATTIVCMRCEDCFLADGSPNHHYMDAVDVIRVKR